MKKRLVCLFLGLIMVLSVLLTSCSDDSDDAMSDLEKEASESALTLSMWVVTENELYDEDGDLTAAGTAAALVNEKLSAITESKFKTRLVLTYLTEEEYREKLEDAIRAYEATKKDEPVVEPEVGSETEEETEYVEETETDEIGMTTIKYPELLKNQVDIIYIAGEDMYFDFVENKWLAPLDTELANASKKINEYVSSTLLSSAKYNGVTYAIPNNHAIGEYTYMLLNKDLMEKYAQQGYITTKKIDGFFNEYLYSFLSLVYKISDLNEVVPIDSVVHTSNASQESDPINAYDYCLDLMAHYWSIDPETYGMLEDFSVFGYHYKDADELSRGSVILGYNSLFEDADFVDDYLKLNQFKFDGYFGDAENKTAAVKFVKGNANTLKQYEDEYYAVVVEYPTASSADIYDDMFGVYANSIDVERSMEIVTYLNTNSTFRNLLQYGVEDTHYELKKDNAGNTVLNRLNNDYMMDIYATGNVFIAYEDPEMSAGIWETGKVQNRDSLVDPLLDFNFAEHAASTAEKEAAELLDSKNGYNLSYTTGYSKDVLSQNEDLAEWFEDCDEKKGVYVFETSFTDGQLTTYMYYIYNNDVTKNVNFSVDVIRDLKTETDKDGNSVTTQTNLDFVVTYSEADGNSDEGYELSVMRIYTRRTNTFEVLAKVNGSDVNPSITQLGGYLDFDFFNTEEYTTDVYKDLSKVDVLQNSVLMDWMDACDKDKSKTPTTYVLTYTSDEKDGKVEKTFVIYRTGLKYITALDIQPTGGSGEVNFVLNYTHDEEYPLFIDTADTEEENYLLTYIRVTVDADMDVDYTVVSNGTVEEVSPSNKESSEVDPNYEVLGTLDTELVKYLYELNSKLVAKLNACTNINDLKALVAEMKLLLSTDEEKVPAVSSFTLLKDIVDEYAVDGKLKNLHRNIRCATSYEDVLYMVPDTESKEEGAMKEGEYKDSVGNVEKYVYYASPYAIYYSWMNTYGYLPSEK